MGHILYAPSSGRPALDDCFFYHSVELPGIGLVEGQWDLRAGAEIYLGNADFSGRRVLEVGPASGFLTFFMEQRGAEVVGLELASGEQWDLVPYAGFDPRAFLDKRQKIQSRLMNAFWFAHQAFGSKAGLTHDSIYGVSGELGEFDVATFGMVLLHLRDPLQALRSVLERTRETAIVTEIFPWGELPPGTEVDFRARLEPWSDDGVFEMPEEQHRSIMAVPPALYLLPRHETEQPKETWWRPNSSLIAEYLSILGFEEQAIHYHYQPHDSRFDFARSPDGQRVFHPCFTIVGHRR